MRGRKLKGPMGPRAWMGKRNLKNASGSGAQGGKTLEARKKGHAALQTDAESIKPAKLPEGSGAGSAGRPEQ